MFPTQITLRNMRSSPALNGRIRDLCEKLGYLHPRILTCRIAIEQAIVRTKAEDATPYSVHLQIRLPEGDIAAAPQQDAELDTALRKAFVVLRRMLRETIVAEREGLQERHLARLGG